MSVMEDVLKANRAEGSDSDYVLSDTDISLLRRGRAYEVLVKSEAWKLLLDWLDNRTDAALTAHKLNLSTEPLVMLAFKNRWKDSNEVFVEFQKHVYGVIDAKRTLVQALIESGMSVQQLESALQVIGPSIER